VVRTEVGYSQGHDPDPNYKLVCSGTTNHVEVVRVQFDPEVCPYTNLLSLFWARHDPTTLDRQVSLPMISFFSFLFFQLCGVMGKMSCLLK
jgi:methionine-S-sulfoxide reductase